jgi:thiol:disulfide interchange protein DsbD
MKALLITVLLLVSPLGFTQDLSFLQSDGEPAYNTSARLISETASFVPGERIWIGLVLEMNEHWHTYWINPGDAGMPTSINWELPEGFSAGDIQWPTPERYMVGEVVSLGYENKAILRIPVDTPAAAVPGTRYTLNGDVSWLECKEACIPGQASVSIELLAATEAGAMNPEMAAAEEKIPTMPGWEAGWTTSAKGATLSVTVPDEGVVLKHFFPKQEGVWLLEPEPVVIQVGDQVKVELINNPDGLEFEAPMVGVLVDEEGKGYWITAQEQSKPLAPTGTSEESAKGTLFYLVSAFFAGLVMNLLPCIFPVLGLKISSFVEQAQGDRAGVKRHALIFAFGVLVSMWALAIGVTVLGGAWGAQFQDPRLVIGMLLVLTFFTLNLFGVFEMGLGMTTVGGDLTRKSGYGGSFFQGILLTVIGTPCTGPILVLVMAWMLAQQVYIAFLVFTLMGLGLSSPYVILAYSPALLDRLPPPGNWMVTFKKASAFAMVAFLWVLMYVLKELIPIDGTIRVLGGLLLVCFAAWVLGTWDTGYRKTRTRIITKIVVVLTLGIATYISFSYKVPVESITSELEARIESGDPIRWSDVTPEVAADLLERGVPVHYQPYSPELVEKLRAEGKAVFVDFTAEWCTICKVNKLRALHREEVMRDFADKGVITLRADWTGRDPVIAGVLESYGRRGVPVYLLFDDKGSDAEILPESLTPEVIREALDKL